MASSDSDFLQLDDKESLKLYGISVNRDSASIVSTQDFDENRFEVGSAFSKDPSIHKPIKTESATGEPSLVVVASGQKQGQKKGVKEVTLGTGNPRCSASSTVEIPRDKLGDKEPFGKSNVKNGAKTKSCSGCDKLRGASSKKKENKKTEKTKKQSNKSKRELKVLAKKTEESRDLAPCTVETYHDLIRLLGEVPFDYNAIDQAINSYYFYCNNDFQMWSWPCLFNLMFFIIKSAETYTFSKEEKSGKLINYLYEYMNDLQQIRWSRPVSGPAALIFAELDSCATKMTETIAKDLYTRKGREWPKWMQELLSDLSSQDWCVKIFKTILRDLERHEEILRVADRFRERRFLYDGSFWSSDRDSRCATWLNFREVYLNGDVLVAFVVQTFERRRRFQEPQNLMEDNVESATGNDSAEGGAYPHEDADLLTIDTSASEDHPYLRDDSDLIFGTGSEEVSNLDLNEEKRLVQNEKLDSRLQRVHQFCINNFTKLTIALFLIIKIVACPVLFNRCFDIVCLLLLFMYMCIYFVIKF